MQHTTVATSFVFVVMAVATATVVSVDVVAGASCVGAGDSVQPQGRTAGQAEGADDDRD